MFYWTDDNETPLTKAVIDNDSETVKRFGKIKEHVEAVNGLGFNALEIAQFLDRRHCLEVLDKSPPKTFKVLPKGKDQLEILNVAEFEKLFEIHYIPTLKFPHYMFLQLAIRECPPIVISKMNFEQLNDFTKKVFRSESDFFNIIDDSPEQIELNGMIYKDQLQKHYIDDISIRWIDDQLGYGVFAERDFIKDEYIGEYVGLTYPGKKIVPSWHVCYLLCYPLSAYMMTKFAVDADDYGNELRFVNHSYSPNLSPHAAMDRKIAHTIYLANQDIPKGTQLTWNYGKSYWQHKEPLTI